MPAAGVRHISHRRFLATFLLASVSRSEQDLYRCVSQAPRGAGVSNFAELIVKGQPAYARVVGGGCWGCHLRGAGSRGCGPQKGVTGRVWPGAGPAEGTDSPLEGGLIEGRGVTERQASGEILLSCEPPLGGVWLRGSGVDPTRLRSAPER